MVDVDRVHDKITLDGVIIKITELVLISDSGAASHAEARQNFNDFDLLYIKYSLGFHVTTG